MMGCFISLNFHLALRLLSHSSPIFLEGPTMWNWHLSHLVNCNAPCSVADLLRDLNMAGWGRCQNFTPLRIEECGKVVSHNGENILWSDTVEQSWANRPKLFSFPSAGGHQQFSYSGADLTNIEVWKEFGRSYSITRRYLLGSQFTTEELTVKVSGYSNTLKWPGKIV